MLGVLLSKKISVFLTVVTTLGVVIRHEVVVEVVVATHPDKEDALGQGLSHIRCTEAIRDLIEGALKVLDLLVKWDSANLHNIIENSIHEFRFTRCSIYKIAILIIVKVSTSGHIHCNNSYGSNLWPLFIFFKGKQTDRVYTLEQKTKLHLNKFFCFNEY